VLNLEEGLLYVRLFLPDAGLSVFHLLRMRESKMWSELKDQFKEALLATAPITGIVVILQVTIVFMPIVVFIRFLIGSALVTVGFSLFLKGVKIALLPMGEMIGGELSKRGSLKFILPASFVLGFIATLAEPNLRILKHQVDLGSDGRIDGNILILAVGLGVGILICLAVLRIILGIPIAWLLAGGYTAILVLSFVTSSDFVPIAFDSGGMATGPVSIPFILALGVGITSVLGGRSSFADSFGLVGLAAIGPILAVMILGMIYQ
jgi:hypothetical protein